MLGWSPPAGQPGDRGRARHQRAHRRPAPAEHLHEARPVVAGRRHRLRLRARARLTLAPALACGARTTRCRRRWRIRSMPAGVAPLRHWALHPRRTRDDPLLQPPTPPPSTGSATAFNRCFETSRRRRRLHRRRLLRSLPAALALPAAGGRRVRGPAADRAGRDGPRGCGRRPDSEGFVLEHQETQADEVARRLWLCKVRDGRIAEVVGYCNGGMGCGAHAPRRRCCAVTRTRDDCMDD